MSSRIVPTALRARAAPTALRRASRFQQPVLLARSNSSDAAATTPPLLQKLKGDLKAAMRAKDANRLSVLRAVMSANLNASKTASPIRTDVQLVALMRKIAKGAEDASAEARAAGRQDLVDKEAAQMAILDEYMQGSGVATLGEAELRAAVESAVQEVKAAGAEGKSVMGGVMKRLNTALEGKDVDKKALADMVKKAASS